MTDGSYSSFTDEAMPLPGKKPHSINSHQLSSFSTVFSPKDNKNNQPRKGLADTFIENLVKLVLQWQEFIGWGRESVSS